MKLEDIQRIFHDMNVIYFSKYDKYFYRCFFCGVINCLPNSIKKYDHVHCSKPGCHGNIRPEDRVSRFFVLRYVFKYYLNKHFHIEKWLMISVEKCWICGGRLKIIDIKYEDGVYLLKLACENEKCNGMNKHFDTEQSIILTEKELKQLTGNKIYIHIKEYFHKLKGE